MEPSLALHTISTLPLDPNFSLFAHYPAVKLGVLESVRYYAHRRLDEILRQVRYEEQLLIPAAVDDIRDGRDTLRGNPQYSRFRLTVKQTFETFRRIPASIGAFLRCPFPRVWWKR
jgi:hypothetical protein